MIQVFNQKDNSLIKISKAMENSEDLAEYVSKLEEAEVSIEDSFSEDNLVEEIEDFLNSEVESFRQTSFYVYLIYDVFSIYV